jgi:peptide/nickel transport system permease protein
MSEAALDVEVGAPPKEEMKGGTSTLSRLAKFSTVRLVMLFVTVVIALFLTILIANMGGYVDEIRRGQIREQVSMAILADPSPEMRQLSDAERRALIDAQVAIQEHRYGLDRPFIVRAWNFLWSAVRLDLGFATSMHSDSGSKTVKLILLERLPATLVMWGLANLILFFLSLLLALFLSRRYGSLVDRAIIALAPTSSAPAWFYAIFLILVFAAWLGVLPFGRMVDDPPPENAFAYALSLAKHLILPTLAIIISAVFLNAYNWRTFFLIYSSEDYVEMAKAKGLSDRAIERRYVLRPTLPTIITQFLLLLITLWTGAIILETVFNWPGLGKALYTAIGLYDTPVIVGSTVIYAYLLGVTVFLLDFIYAAVDPRVRIGGGGPKA